MVDVHHPHDQWICTVDSLETHSFPTYVHHAPTHTYLSTSKSLTVRLLACSLFTQLSYVGRPIPFGYTWMVGIRRCDRFPSQ